MAKGHCHPAHRKMFDLTVWDVEMIADALRKFDKSHLSETDRRQFESLRDAIGSAQKIHVTPWN